MSVVVVEVVVAVDFIFNDEIGLNYTKSSGAAVFFFVIKYKVSALRICYGWRQRVPFCLMPLLLNANFLSAQEPGLDTTNYKPKIHSCCGSWLWPPKK